MPLVDIIFCVIHQQAHTNQYMLTQICENLVGVVAKMTIISHLKISAYFTQYQCPNTALILAPAPSVWKGLFDDDLRMMEIYMDDMKFPLTIGLLN